MKYGKGAVVLSAFLLMLSLVVGCASATQEQVGTDSAADKIADSSEMTEVEDVIDESMTPIFADQLNDGTYSITVDSSSSMFKIVSCELTVANGAMTAEMTMAGKGYLWVYMGTAEEAAKASESDYIPCAENDHGAHCFTVPVEALDSGIDCAAFSKNKEKWYARTLVFEADSLPADAFKNGEFTTVPSLNLVNGSYSVEVSIAGGTGRTSIESPTTLTIIDDKATAKIIWSSSNYDYMIVDGEKYLPVNSEGNSTFEIPVEFFNNGMKVVADTTAMSQPHEIEYTLSFDSATIRPV